MSQSKSKLARALETIANLRRQLKEKAGTPSSTWAASGEPDPHGDRYNCERAQLALGYLTDDQLANGAFMNYDRPLDIAAIQSNQPGYHSPIAWMTAVKDRIRWLSRKLEEGDTERRQLADQNANLLKLSENAAMRIKELDLLFGRYLLAMKAAVIDADQRGDEEGMRWIYNSLAGPGELPSEDETDAQAYFDREIKAVDAGMAEVFAYFDAQRKDAKAVPQ